MPPMIETIHTYTRTEALTDGVLVDASLLAREAGFNWQVALTDHLYHRYVVPSLDLANQGQSIEGRLWDILQVLRVAIRSTTIQDTLSFSVAFIMAPDTIEEVELVAHAGPGDRFEPVLTIMLPGDD